MGPLILDVVATAIVVGIPAVMSARFINLAIEEHKRGQLDLMFLSIGCAVIVEGFLIWVIVTER